MAFSPYAGKANPDRHLRLNRLLWAVEASSIRSTGASALPATGEGPTNKQPVSGARPAGGPHRCPGSLGPANAIFVGGTFKSQPPPPPSGIQRRTRTLSPTISPFFHGACQQKTWPSKPDRRQHRPQPNGCVSTHRCPSVSEAVSWAEEYRPVILSCGCFNERKQS